MKVISSSKVIKFFNTKISNSEDKDCVVKAIAVAFNVTYNQAHKFTQQFYLRKNGKGVRSYIFHNKNDDASLNKTKFFGKYLKTVGIKKDFALYNHDLRPLQKKKGRFIKMTLKTFIKNYPQGTFIISVRGHAFTIKDGICIGNTGYQHDGRDRVIVQKAWEVVS